VVARSGARTLSVVSPERAAGLVVRVSTDRQAQNDEGSLKNQLQRLRQHIEYKTGVAGEDWTEAAVYELKAISGKDSMRSAEFGRLFADIRSGRINTILCTSLDRICRSVRDFLHFFEVLSEHNVEFVCLKQNYDTTSPQGKLFVTIMMALAEFEREQTAERTRDAAQTRSQRGLWNGGRVVGYDLDADRKGHLVPNPDEAALVNFAFDTYLDLGTIRDTAELMNRRGYRTKAYRSRRLVEHDGGEFRFTTVRHMLANLTYIGKKLITSTDGEKIIDAVWPGIVDSEKFQRVQEMLALNARVHRSQVAPIRHAHVLSGGLLVCGRCDSPMQGRSGTGKQGKTYFYYACSRPGCGMRVVATEAEDAILDRFRGLANHAETVERLTDETNRRLQAKLPELEKQLRSHERALKRVNAAAGKLLAQTDSDEGRGFLNDQLRALSRQKDDLESALVESQSALRATRDARASADDVREGLRNFDRIYAHLKPFEQRELVRLTLDKAGIGDRELVLHLKRRSLHGVRTGSEKSAIP
jgi:site-specific DNA recombinase